MFSEINSIYLESVFLLIPHIGLAVSLSYFNPDKVTDFAVVLGHVASYIFFTLDGLNIVVMPRDI